jgi:hypothetical protein
MKPSLTFAAVIIALSLSLPAPAALAQTPSASSTPEATPTPTPDPVLEQAQREAKLADELKKKAVADKERAEAEAARLKALVQPLGTPANVTVPTGSVTTDAAGWVEAQMLAKEAAGQITRRLTQTLCNGTITPGEGQASAQKVKALVIHSPADLAGVELYGSIMGQLKKLQDELTKKNKEAEDFLKKTDPARVPGPGITDVDPTLAFAAPGIATGVIKSVAELLNLFRTDTSFSNQAITLNENIIVSHLVRNFNSGSVTGNNCDSTIRVYHPALYAPRLLETSENSDLIKLLNDVETAKVEAAGNVEKLDARIKQLKELSAAFKSREDKEAERKNKKEKELPGCKKDENPAACRKKVLAEIKALDKEIKKLDADLKDVKADPNNFKDWIVKLTDLRAKTQGLVTATNLISTKLNTPDEATKLTALAQLLRAERLHKILSTPGSYTLHVEVKANGTTKVKKNLFVDAKVRHSAGADLTYQLIEGGGVIAQGDELKCYIEYQSARNVQDMVSGTGTKRVVCKFPDNSTESEDDQKPGECSKRAPGSSITSRREGTKGHGREDRGGATGAVAVGTRARHLRREHLHGGRAGRRHARLR